MSSFFFGFQIFITVLLVLVIIFQKSSSDGIAVSGTGGQLANNSQASFITKLTIILIFIFMLNSIFLARNSITEYKKSRSIIESLEKKDDLKKSSEESIDVGRMD